ncbi:MAG: VWA domain-containing protein [Oscillospiraceae bacterium]|nr:VWA domain-containing protein [Oscillospiraceae bacterium]
MKRKKNLPFILLMMLILVSSSFYIVFRSEEVSAATTVDEDKTLAPYFYIEDGDDKSVDSFPLKETDVSTNINGVIADTYVTQTYANEGTKPINATYCFPASTKVTIHGMKMQIGDYEITAVIKEKEEAKQEFEQAKAEGKSASLLEEQRPNVFTMNVANIMPGDTVHIELHYTELITSTEGTYEFVFPTVVGPRYVSNTKDTDNDSVGDQWVATPYLKEGNLPPGKYNITVNLNAGVPISELSCKSHDVNIVKSSDSTAAVTLKDPEDYAGNRDFILDYKLTSQGINSGLMLYSSETENYFMLMVQPPERSAIKDIPPREYIFVLDVSGSMFGYPLDTAKVLIKNLVSDLKETDTFNIVFFAGGSTKMSSKSIPATAENIKSAIDIIDKQDGGGGTELAAGLSEAIHTPMDENMSRSIVVITDGYINAEKETFNLINKNLSNTNFFAFGVGEAVNRYLIEGIAKAGLGEPFIVTDSTDAQSTSDKFCKYINAPVLTNINVTYDGFDAYDVEPTSIPTLFAERPIVVYGKYRGEPNGTIHISGKTGSGDYSQDISVSDYKPQETNTAISYLWARAKVENLTEYGFNENEDVDGSKQEVTAIGLKYSMMTPYTSFVAVLDMVRNTDKAATNVNQPSPLPLGVSNLAVGYTNGSEPDSIILILIMMFTIFISVLLKKRFYRR